MSKQLVLDSRLGVLASRVYLSNGRFYRNGNLSTPNTKVKKNNSAVF